MSSDLLFKTVKVMLIRCVQVSDQLLLCSLPNLSHLPCHHYGREDGISWVGAED